MSSAALSAEIAALDTEIREIEEYEQRWSTGARRARKAQLERELHDAARREVEAKQEAARIYATLSNALEERYGEVIAKLADLNRSVESLQDLRAETRRALDRAVKLSATDVPVLPERLSVRAARDAAIRNELYALRAWAGGDP